MSEFAADYRFEYVEANTKTNFNVSDTIWDLVRTQGRKACKVKAQFPKCEKFKKVCYWASVIIIWIPLGLFFTMTYLSPLHATLILFADFVFDPKKANT
jgi:hypothetical protein